MTTLAYLGTHIQNCARNSPFFRCAGAHGWRVQHLNSLPHPGKMPDMMAIETPFIALFLQTPMAVKTPWIWISSDPADALQAWALNADFFLLEPLQKLQVEQAFQRLELRLHGNNSNAGPVALGSTALDLTLIKGRKIRISFPDILYLEAQAEITHLYTKVLHHEKLVATRNLGFWETRLPEGRFFRTHKKFIVNLSHVTGLQYDTLQLDGGHAVPIAKRRLKAVEQVLLTRGFELE